VNHIKHTGFPWEEEANVYIAGHRLGYEGDT
jgi:sortase A